MAGRIETFLSRRPITDVHFKLPAETTSQVKSRQQEMDFGPVEDLL